MDLLAEARAQKNYMVELRRHFHAYPELSWQEVETSRRIRQELDAMSIPYERVEETGVVAFLHGPAGSPYIGLRADMDALPIQEKSNVPYASQTAGVMHACGHDAHVAILLGVARLLKQHQGQLKTGVKLIFQPAEEVISGARKLAESPLLQGLAAVGAVHVWNTLEVGTISVLPGARMASADSFFIKVEGLGAHGSMPHLGVDALYVASMIENALQHLVARRCDPLQPVVVSVGSLNSGTASNIVASHAQMSGTIRTFDAALRQQIPQWIEHLCTHIAEAFGACATYEQVWGTPPMVNEERCTAIAQECAARVVGKERVAFCERTTGGEDFAYFLEKAPGMLALVGSRNEGENKCSPHHHECFDIDEEALVNGAAFLCEYTMALQQHLP